MGIRKESWWGQYDWKRKQDIHSNEYQCNHSQLGQEQWEIEPKTKNVNKAEQINKRGEAESKI